MVASPEWLLAERAFVRKDLTLTLTLDRRRDRFPTALHDMALLLLIRHGIDQLGGGVDADLALSSRRPYGLVALVGDVLSGDNRTN